MLIALLAVLGVDLAVNAAGSDIRDARPGEVRRIGRHPKIVSLEADGGARIAIGVAGNGGKASVAE
jgi:hypothetical protein